MVRGWCMLGTRACFLIVLLAEAKVGFTRVVTHIDPGARRVQGGCEEGIDAARGSLGTPNIKDS